MPTSRYERAARSAGYRVIAGLDEAGRGALFGPVFAAAVVLDPERPIRGLDDSKQLEPERREVLAARIRERALAWAVGAADAFEIDRINIYQASRLAMRRALEQLASALRLPAARRRHAATLPLPQKAADPRRRAAAFRSPPLRFWPRSSARCRARRMGPRFPGVRLGAQQGLLDAGSLSRALERLGPTTLHRFSFEPVRTASRLSGLDRLSRRCVPTIRTRRAVCMSLSPDNSPGMPG